MAKKRQIKTGYLQGKPLVFQCLNLKKKKKIKIIKTFSKYENSYPMSLSLIKQQIMLKE